MKSIDTIKLTLLVVFLTAFESVVAQDSQSDQADVWATVEDQWAADEKGDDDWIGRLLADDFSGWQKDSPAPRSKSSTRMWDRFNDKLGKTVMHELYPLAIVVNGDVAVAHYLYSNAYENKDGEVEMNKGRFSDVLIRTADGWKFIAWHGGNDD